jgi:NDP-sugar pyrophosphorylase family protein
MSDLIGLIPAAGRGVRAYPFTTTVPKSMLEVDGVPLLQRNLELMRDQLAIHEVVIVVGHHGDVIQRRFGDGAALGLAIRYVRNQRLELELPYSVFLAGRTIGRPCCMILGDECYVGSNHRDLLASPYGTALVTCGVIQGDYAKQIRKNYAVALRDGHIVDLMEKPRVVTGPLMGTGTYLLSPEVFRRLEVAYGDDHSKGPRDWTTWLGEQARGGATILPFMLTGQYVNVNSRDDLNQANCLVRDRVFDEQTISLVYVVDGDDEAVAKPLERFGGLEDIDEIVAVVRKPSRALERLEVDHRLRVVTAPRPDLPIGNLLKLGMDSARGGILLLSYSDDTLAPRDVAKFLVYLRDADLVIGTRTTRQMIEQGTNMRGIVRAAHLVLAKLVQLLWWRFEPRFTDICCVYRALWRSTYETIRDNLAAQGVEIYPEMVVEVLRARRRVIEIPINYYNRDLHHRHVRSRYQSIATFYRIVSLIVRRRFLDSPLGRRGGHG